MNVVLAGVLRSLSVLPTVALLSLAGCASQPDYLFIVPNVKDIVTSQDPAPAYRDAITAAPVRGGKDVSILSIPYISNADFQEALVRTLANAKLASASNGRFRLDATLDDAVDNNNRLRIADQRAIRANLQQLVQDLYALPLR